MASSRLAMLCCVLVFAVARAVADAFVLPPSPPSPLVSTPHRQANKVERPEPPSESGAILMAVLAGLMVGIAAPASWAITGPGGTRPDLQMVPPGSEDVLAAAKPRHIDDVIRSRMEAVYFPQVAEELKTERAKLEAAPAKQERLKQTMQQLREYSQSAVFNTSEVPM
ncbi:unnamed protein product [Symbiodinium natans]|uniref:Transmembrane protein n=1 Tax=Symbiodinium natans TaxID=878477 RepID=A0A812PSV6_9DINO|nr:unnamed protein product [Symbiodinium natans]